MKELYELKERLIDELKDYSKKDISSTNLQHIDTLAHAAKNVCKIIDDSDDGNSGYYDDTRTYRGYSRNHAYRRDGMGRYSREGLADKLRDLMNESPDETTRMEIKRLIDKM